MGTLAGAEIMNEQRITRWKDVAALLAQGWTIDGFDVVSPTGERRSAWGNAISSCRRRGLVKDSQSHEP